MESLSNYYKFDSFQIDLARKLRNFQESIFPNL